jgi:uridine kinase
VLTQIEDRKNDFKTYILPQKKKSDIIIKFYNQNDEDLSLKIMISNKFDARLISNHFINGRVNYRECFT